ncbi:MAG: NERD domain-containing protein [Chloroflexota bacterium]|nr:NERD domain-containing protein [Chloroflexota bacterium]
MAHGSGRVHHPRMHVVGRRPRRKRGTRYVAALVGVVVGCMFLGAGVAMTYVALTTPVVSDLARLGQGRVGSPLGGTLVWALAFIVPGTLIVLGLARLLSAVELSLALRGSALRPVASLAARLSDDYTVAEDVRLPDRRIIPEVVVGPHGLALIEELPPHRASRQRGPYWEVRLLSGRWVPIENPFDRAARDAERLRSWIRSLEEDFSPRVYTAVVGDGHRVDRTNEVAVVTRDQIPGFLAALPPVRHMTHERQARLVELLRRAA